MENDDDITEMIHYTRGDLISNGIVEMFSDQCWFDSTVVIENLEIPTYRLILSICCEFFKNHFEKLPGMLRGMYVSWVSHLK